MNTNTNINNQGLNQQAHHNPLDRNHDGKVNLADLTHGRQNNQPTFNGQNLQPGLVNTTTSTTTQQLGAQPILAQQPILTQQPIVSGQTTYVQSTQRASLGLTRAEPTIMETIQKDVVVHEHIHPVQKEEIQPIIYREREQLDVKQVTQMMHETQIQPTLIQQRELPAEHRAAVVERGAPIQENFVAASREVDATMRTQVVHAPIVNEVIKKKVIEEIQPVLERDIITSTVIQNTQPIYEKFVEAPTVYREVVTVQDRGVVGGDLAALEAQGFNLGATGRRLSQGYGSAPLAGLNAQGLPLAQGGMYQTGLNQQGLAGQAHHNPLDRNHDGRVNLQDLHSGQQQGLYNNQQGLYNNQQGLNQGLAGENLLTNRGLEGAHHANPLDRNHDGKVNLQDLSGRQNTATANRPVNLL